MTKQEIQERIEEITEEIEDYYHSHINLGQIASGRKKAREDVLSLISDVVKEIDTEVCICGDNTCPINERWRKREAKRKELLGD